jgi:hypothetical protein
LLNSAFLTLLIGPAMVPLPAPLPVTEALQRIEVNHARERSGFQLTFTMGKTSPLQLAMLPLGYFDPIVTRVVIIVTFRGLPHVLIDGIITRQDMAPSNDPGQSTLTITGEDLSVLMDIVEARIPHPPMPDAGRVALILGKYAAYGVVPMVVPPPVPTVPDPLQIMVQTTTDRTYLKSLAAESGYVFYVQAGPAPLQSMAYFGPDARLPVPQPALSINSDGSSNVESLSFSLDGLAKKVMVMFIMDPVTRKIPIPIPVPNISILHPPLGARLTAPAKVQFSDDTARLPPDEAAKRAFGLMMDNADAVTGNGSLSVSRYGHILRAGMMVGVRGAGLTYDGFYYVNSVTHSIKRGEYKQSFQISRDGLITNTPVVMP